MGWFTSTLIICIRNSNRKAYMKATLFSLLLLLCCLIIISLNEDQFFGDEDGKWNKSSHQKEKHVFLFWLTGLWALKMQFQLDNSMSFMIIGVFCFTAPSGLGFRGLFFTHWINLVFFSVNRQFHTSLQHPSYNLNFLEPKSTCHHCTWFT